MPASPARIFARIFSYSVPDGADDGEMSFVIEWKLLESPFDSGKITFTPPPIISDTRLKDDLRDALASYLSTRYSPETFQPRDIVGYSV
jgi:hypothetical protein